MYYKLSRNAVLFSRCTSSCYTQSTGSSRQLSCKSNGSVEMAEVQQVSSLWLTSSEAALCFQPTRLPHTTATIHIAQWQQCTVICLSWHRALEDLDAFWDPNNYSNTLKSICLNQEWTNLKSMCSYPVPSSKRSEHYTESLVPCIFIILL